MTANVALVAASKPVSFLSKLVLTDDVAAALQRGYASATPVKGEKPATSKLAKVKRERREKGEKKAKATTDVKWIYASPIAAKRPSPKAPQFLAAMRDAGCKLVEVTNPVTGEVRFAKVFDAKLYRTEAMWCVAIYAGWTDEPWGTQVDRAVNHARFDLLPKGARYSHRSAEAHNARWTAEGWTKGAPDVFGKIEMDLCARERAAVEEVATLDALYDMSGKAGEQAAFGRRLDRLAKEDPGLAALVKQRPDLLGTMLAIAEQRLGTVREDIATFDFADPTVVEKRYATLNMRGLGTLVEGISLMHEFSKS